VKAFGEGRRWFEGGSEERRDAEPGRAAAAPATAPLTPLRARLTTSLVD